MQDILSFPVSFDTESAEQTEEAGRSLAKYLSENFDFAFVAMYGDLGVGKTAFVRGFTSHFGAARVKSPTYTVVNEYKGKNLPLYHFDVYRIEDEDDLYSVGFYEYLQKGICVVEWSENIEDSIPENAYRVTIERGANPENERIITIEG